MKWIILVSLVCLFAGCSTTPLATETEKAEPPRYRFDTSTAGTAQYNIEIDSSMDGPPVYPARVNYIEADNDTWENAFSSVFVALLMGSTEDTPIDLIVYGPALTEIIRSFDFDDKYEPTIIKMNVDIDGIPHVFNSIAYNREHSNEGLILSFRGIRNEIVEDGVFNIRRPTVSELDWYWTIISWDIFEPVFILETSQHSFFFDYGFMDTEGMVYIDEYRDLEWLEE